MAPFEALYGRICRSPIGWFEIGEAELIGPDLVHWAMEKVKTIKERLKASQSCQKSYSDVRRRGLEFQDDDWVFLKRVGQVAYKLELPPEMSLVHLVFHVSMLKKVVEDSSLIVLIETIKDWVMGFLTGG
uniref:Tf2-1-like SH3-like domain-containing protein n=1 Tax=Nicotiana tabacum TaxID=4097 RepID=A0A1S4AH46_TOBAC|nr:PREDICTED: uncharacterized protein LOC107797553 [Nicotiana tabacum]